MGGYCMKKVLFFRLNCSNYLFYVVDGCVRASRIKNNKFLGILNADKKIIQSFIENLCDNRFDDCFLTDNNITILDFNDIDFTGVYKSIELVFSVKKRRFFFKNCSRFYHKRRIFIPIISSFLGCLVLVVCLFLYS